MKRFKRRTVFRWSAGVLAGFPGLWLSRKAVADGMRGPGKSTVAVARRDGLFSTDGVVDRKTLAGLLDQSVASATGQKDADVAWQKLFSSKDTVGLKVNTLGGAHLSPHPELMDCIAERLKGCGVPPQRIIVWDRFERELRRARLVAPDIQSGITVAATDSQGIGYERDPEISGSIGSCFSRLLSHYCTAMINVGVLKDHDLSGTSIGMKNLFGVIHNPNKYHFHVNKDPYLADVCLHPHIAHKQRLIICDGLRAQCDGGPAYHEAAAWDYNGILVSTDIVALDRIGTDILDKRRQETGLPPLKETNREPLYLAVAEEKNVGWSDRTKINVIEIE